MSIKDIFLKKIFLIVLTASILGVAVINFFIYPSFTKMLIANTESEAITIGRHIARMIFPENNPSQKKLTPKNIDDINHAAQEFNLYKLKIFFPNGETAYSTDRRDIGAINDKDYFHSIVARGKPFTKIVDHGKKSLEDQQVTTDVVETYVPYMQSGSFTGALEIYLDITQKKRMLQSTLLICNVVSIGLILLFSAIIMTTLFRLDTSLTERNKINSNLEKSNKLLHREIDARKKVQVEKEDLIVELQTSLEKVKLLSGFLPICASCKKIRDDKGYWNQIESYIRDHSEVEFSHGICPECLDKHYPQFVHEKA